MGSQISNKQSFMVPVEIVKTEDILENNELTASNISHAVVVDTPNEGRKIVNFCSNVYGLLKNEDLFPPFEESLKDAGIGFDATYRHSNFVKFYVDYELDADPIKVTDHSEDTIKPIIRIMHSYNGSIRYRAELGFKRLICSNGMWGYTSKASIGLKHTGENVNFMFSKTINAINEFVDSAHQVRENYSQLSGREVLSIPERVDQVMEGVPQFHKRQRDEVIKRAQLEAGEHGLPQDDWLVYNAFNYQLNHNEDIGSSEEHKMKLDNKIFKYISNN